MTIHASKAKSAKAIEPPRKKRRLAIFGDSIEELKKAHWPTRRETMRLSLLVLLVCVATGIALGLIDLGLSKLVIMLLSGA